jgi:hypothetical protein
VEGDTLGDACHPKPLLQGLLRVGAPHTLEHLASFLGWSAQFVSLIADGQRSHSTCLDRGDAHTESTLRGCLYILPLQVDDVAYAQSCETGEERGTAQHLMSAGRVGQSFQFLLRQVVLLHFLLYMAAEF